MRKPEMNIIPMLDVLFVLVVVLLKIAAMPTTASAEAVDGTSTHAVLLSQDGYKFCERDYTESEIDSLVKDIKSHVSHKGVINLKPQGTISYHAVKAFAGMLNRHGYRVRCS